MTSTIRTYCWPPAPLSDKHGLGSTSATRSGASALTQTDGAGNLLGLARIEEAAAFQTNGFGSALCSARYRLMAACRSTIKWKLPRRMRLQVSAEKKFSPAFNQDAAVGVK